MARNGNLNVFEKDFLRRKADFLITSEIECYTARKIRNKLAHPSPNDKKIDVSEISQSVDYLIKAIEGLDSIENKASLGKYFFIGIGILFCLTIIGELGVFGIILIAVGLIVFIAAKSSDEKNNRE